MFSSVYEFLFILSLRAKFVISIRRLRLCDFVPMTELFEGSADLSSDIPIRMAVDENIACRRPGAAASLRLEDVCRGSSRQSIDSFRLGTAGTVLRSTPIFAISESDSRARTSARVRQS